MTQDCRSTWEEWSNVEDGLFETGDTVQCRLYLEDEWLTGTVVAPDARATMGELLDNAHKAQRSLAQRRQRIASALAGAPTAELTAKITRLEAHRAECCASEMECDTYWEINDLRWVIEQREDAP